MQPGCGLNPIAARESQKNISDPVMGWRCGCEKGSPRRKCSDGTGGVEDTAGTGVDELFKIGTRDLFSELIQNSKVAPSPENRSQYLRSFHITDGFESCSVFVAQRGFILWRLVAPVRLLDHRGYPPGFA